MNSVIPLFIDTEGVSGLDVNLGNGGLGLKGEVSMFWNGGKKYEGPVKRITLESSD